MTDMAYQLLALFLVQHELVLVAAMLNTRVRFRRLHGAALEQAALDEGMLVELPGYSNGLLSASSSADTSSGTAASTGRLAHSIGPVRLHSQTDDTHHI